MAKQSAKFQCQQCATVLTKWAGQCPECKSWNSIQELQAVSSGGAGRGNWAEHKTSSEIVTLEQVPDSEAVRFSSCIDELDRVLGGGMVHGSVVLLGGDPGIGKSTILLQCLTQVSQQQDGGFADPRIAAQQHHRAMHHAAAEYPVELIDTTSEAHGLTVRHLLQGDDLAAGFMFCPVTATGAAAADRLQFLDTVPAFALRALTGPLGQHGGALLALEFRGLLGHVQDAGVLSSADSGCGSFSASLIRTVLTMLFLICMISIG